MLTNTWKDAQYPSLSEKCKSKLQWGTISHQSEWLLSKSLQTINSGEGAEKREPPYTIGGNANLYSPYGEQCGDSLKNWKYNCLVTQKSYCWAYTPRKPETHVERDTCTQMFIAALFTIVKTWKQPRCPLADKWIRKLWYIYHTHNGILLSY